MSRFGALLRQHRTAAGLSQESLAERARMSVEGISALERGYRQTPQRQTVTALAEALDLTGDARYEFEARAQRAEPEALAEPSYEVRLPAALSAFIGRVDEVAGISALPRKSPTTRSAVCVLPTPPLPTSVTSRFCRSSALIPATSSTRPMNAESAAGKRTS